MSWKTVALGDVCEMYQPKTITSKDLVADGEYSVYGANGIIGKYSSFNHEHGQLVIGCRGSVGSVHMTKPNSWITGNAMVINPKSNDIDLRFLEYFFRGAVDLSKAITGAAQPQITRTSLSPITFSYPSLSIQTKIVAKLDVIFAEIGKAISATEDNLKNAEALFESYMEITFQKLFNSCEMSFLVDVTKKISDGVHKKPTYTDYGIPFLKINNLTEGNGISFENVSYISQQDHVEFKKRTNPEKGDILITKDGTIGVVRVIETDVEFSIFVSLALIKPKAIIDSHFLKFLLTSPQIQKLLIPQGAAIKHIYLTDLRKLSVPVPSLELQKKIKDDLSIFSDTIEEMKSCLSSKLSQLILFRESILKKAFNGELVKD